MRGARTALLLALASVLLSLADVSAQRQTIDLRLVSIGPADLPRGFTVVESQTAYEPLRTGTSTSDAEIVGVVFRTTMERPQTLENLQSGPIRVGQLIARSDDPSRAGFSLEAQRAFNVREHGFEDAAGCEPPEAMLCLVRRDGSLVEYRVAVVRSSDTLVSTTWAGLPSAVDLDGIVSLTRVSLARYDELSAGQGMAERPRGAELEAAARQRQPVPSATLVPPTATPHPPTATPLPPPTRRDAPTATATPKSSPRLPDQVDRRLEQQWTELMASSATKGEEKLSGYLRRIVESTDVKIKVGSLPPNVGGQLRRVAEIDGGEASVVESEITVNKDVLNESPRVIAAMLAHEITHANQRLMRSGQLANCVDAEVQAYAVQAEVWGAFWGSEHRPGQTKWERSMNYVEEIWRSQGEPGLRQLVVGETDATAHSCIDR